MTLNDWLHQYDDEHPGARVELADTAEKLLRDPAVVRVLDILERRTVYALISTPLGNAQEIQTRLVLVKQVQALRELLDGMCAQSPLTDDDIMRERQPKRE
jgi:hypothetical protein